MSTIQSWQMHRSDIGIVACSAEGAALCYRTICVEGAAILGPHAHPEITVYTCSLADYMACKYRGDRAGVGELMLASAHKLKAVGADFLVCPDNTIHQALPHVVRRSPLPWLHIAEKVASEAVARGFKRVAITGTRWLVDSKVYPDVLTARGLAYMRPTQDQNPEQIEPVLDPRHRAAQGKDSGPDKVEHQQERFHRGLSYPKPDDPPLSSPGRS